MLFSIPLAIAGAAGIALASPVEPKAKTAVVPLKHHNNAKSLKNLVERGQARLNKVNNRVDAAEVSSGSISNEEVSYIAEVSIGGSTYDLIVDTGSSNTWCGAQSACEPTSSGKSTGGSVSVPYGSGSLSSSFSGREYTDKVSFGGLTVSQSIGAATKSQGFSGVDGIIGFGPVDLTEDTVSNANTVPTFMDNLVSQGLISSEVLGVSFRPESGSGTDDNNGELTLGGTDSSKFSGSISYVPKLKSGDASPYWGVSVSSITFGSTTLATSATGIVDTGTTLIYIPTSAYNKFTSATGGKNDPSGLVVFTKKPTQNFVFKLGSTTLTLTPAQYLVPTAQYSNFGLSSSKFYGWFGDGGSSGVDTVIGQKLLENYYSVFDTDNARIGFAPAV